MPVSADGMSAGVIGKYIMISGYLHTKAYSFDSETSIYLEMIALPDFKDKIFCVGYGKAYLLCNKKLYECKSGNPYE